MAKTLAQIITDSRQIIGQPIEAESHFTDDQLTIWGNDAYWKLAVGLRSLPISIRDYTVATGNIALNSATVAVDSAKYYDSELSKYIEIEPISIDELMDINPDYENATAGNPKYLARLGVFVVILYPPPKTALVGETLRLNEFAMPTELSADDDTPDLPPNLHALISHYIAHRAFLYIERFEDATAQLVLFRSGLKDMLQVSREFSRQRRSFAFEAGADDTY